MTDDIWRRDRDDEEAEPLFGEHEPTRDQEAVDDGLTFGASDTGSLPHWTEPPTGEVPRLGRRRGRSCRRRHRRRARRVVVVHLRVAGLEGRFADRTGRRRRARRSPYRPARGDPDDLTRSGPRAVADHDRHRSVGHAAAPPGADRPPPRRQPAGRPVSSPRSAAQPSNRNCRSRLRLESLLAAVFVAAVLWRPLGVIALITVIIALAAVEFYDRVTEKGYRPAVVPGIAARVAAPLATYWIGERALPIVIAFGFMAASAGFIGGRERRSRARCRMPRSPRSASSGSACSVRSWR